ncbi:MAG: glycosyltransferase family 4 protein [Bacteroidetes bacterium]|nr:glycosyltransferase family 4 protein [Bacteroidota bacterium]
MKILVINWQDILNPLGGGAEVHFHEIFKRIAARGHEVTLFCSSVSGRPSAEVIDGIRVVREGSRATFNFHVPLRYRSTFARESYDVVVDDLNKIPFYTPRYVREPLVTIVHHLFGTSIFKEAIFPAAAYVWGAEQVAMRVYRRGLFAAVSPSTKRELEEHGVPGSNISLVHNAVDHDLYKPPVAPRTPGLTIGYLGRIKAYKSVDHLLRAFARLRAAIPGATLVVVGDGDAKPGLERLAAELGLGGSVEFTGFVSPEEKVRRLQQMDLVVNPSAKEGWGLTVVEANACGVPVIASDVPGLRDSVIDGTTGWLYPYGDLERLAAMMERVLRDVPERQRVAREAVQWAGTFTWEASADAMMRVMDEARKAKHEMRNKS